jgi:DNA-binding transcriptional LysR family regulator
MLASATGIGETLNDLKILLYGKEQSIKGKITLTLPDVFTTHLILPALTKFQDKWPEVTIKLISSYEVLDLNLQEADIAIRTTNTPDEQLVGRELGTMFQAAYASHGYIRHFKNHSKNNYQHKLIRPAESSSQDLQLFEQFSSNLPFNTSLIANNIEAQLVAAKLGKGIATLPCLIGDQDTQLVRIGQAYPRMEIWLLSHKNLRNSKRMKLFRRFLVDLFDENKSLISGKYNSH